MHQSATPSLSQTNWPRWAPKQFWSLPIVQTLLPVTFAYSLSSESVFMRNWGDERGCDEGQWHAYTRGLPWDLPEDVGTVQQVHCSQRRLLRRGLEFHVCTINKSAPYENSVETYLMTLEQEKKAWVFSMSFWRLEVFRDIKAEVLFIPNLKSKWRCVHWR